MTLFNNFFKKMFGNKEEQSTPPDNPVFNNWEDNYDTRMKKLESSVRAWLVDGIKESGPVSFSWESGNDEAFMTVEDLDEFSDRKEALEEYLLYALDIPSAGEFEMNGSGVVCIEGEWVKAKYKSVFKELLDFDEETETEIFSEEMIEEEEVELFTIHPKK